MMRRFGIGATLALLVLASCGGSFKPPGSGGGGGGYESPDGVGKALARAASTGNPEEVDALFPPADRLRALIQCSESDFQNMIMRPIDKAREELKEDRGQVRMRWLGGEEGSRETLRAGQNKDGCVAKVDIQAVDYRLRAEVTKDGDTREISEKITVIKVDGGWWLFDL